MPAFFGRLPSAGRSTACRARLPHAISVTWKRMAELEARVCEQTQSPSSGGLGRVDLGLQTVAVCDLTPGAKHIIGSNNMKILHTATLIVSCILFSVGCGGIGLAYDHKIDDNFTLEAVDDSSLIALTNKNGNYLIPPRITAAAWNKECLMLIRTPIAGRGIIAQREFYIVDLTTKKISDPFSRNEFIKRRKAMSVCDTVLESKNLSANPQDMALIN